MRNYHLAKHPDRVFKVKVPKDTFYLDIEDVIIHLAKIGINKTDIQQKIKDCNLVNLPTKLEGYSCNLCKVLNTNSVKEFQLHMKEVCKVTNREDRARHLVSFCRGCHSRFASKVELSQHVEKRSCWPSMKVISTVYEQCGSTAEEDAVEIVEKENMIKLKQVKAKADAREEHFQALPKVAHSGHSLSTSQDSSQQFQCVIPTKFDLQNILMNVRDNLSVPPPPPPVSLHPSIAKNKSLCRRRKPNVIEVINTSSWSSISGISPLNTSSSLSISSDLFLPDNSSALSGMFDSSTLKERQPRPSVTPLPGYAHGRPGQCSALAAKIFAEAEERDNCAWSRCLWTDHHTATCSKPEIMDRCGRDLCDWYSMHRDYPICDKLSFYCNCKRLEDGTYKYYDNILQVLKIPTVVDGRRDDTVIESMAVPMRLLYRSVSTVVEDPRVSKVSYPTPSPQPSALSIMRGKNLVEKGWSQRDVIYPWQAVTMGKVKVTTDNNPHIVVDDCGGALSRCSWSASNSC